MEGGGGGGVQNGVQTKPCIDENDAEARTITHRSCWRCRTNLEKLLSVFLVVAITAAVAMLIIISTMENHRESAKLGPLQYEKGPPDGKKNVCLTKKCVLTSSRILSAMDHSVEPCEDFFSYACGTWNKKNVIPDDRSSYNTFGKLRDELHVSLKALLEEPPSPKEIQAIHNAKNLYHSCLNLRAIGKRGDKPARKILQELGGWPVLEENWDESKFDLIDLMATLRMYSNRILVNQWVDSDDRNSSVNIIQLDQPHLGMPSREYYLKDRNDEQLMAYQQFCINVAKRMGADPEKAEREMIEVIDFEVKLANITVAASLRRDTEALYNRMTVHEVYTNISSKIDWSRYLNLMFNRINMTIGMSEEIVIYAPEYLRNLAVLLETIPHRTVANYMLWRIMMHRVGDLGTEFLELRRQYNKALHGTNKDRARWRECVSYVNDNFGMAVGRMFVQKHFDESAKADALAMIANIRRSFNVLLNEVEWMDKETAEVAREKANAIQEKIGYPEYILNDTLLNSDYIGLDMNKDEYFENVLTSLQFAARDNLKNLRKPIDRNKWSTTPCTVNAFYSSTKNQIMFPAGFLQEPFYHPDYPKSLNYGGIGMVIGHEITHGFDDKGRQFDKDGNLKQWWQPQAIQKFKDRAECIVKQYSNYTIEEVQLNLNGRQTQGENIADNGGLKQAFRAYREWVKSQGKEEPILPGLGLSHNQLFFLNFAQIWCGTSRRENYIQTVRSGRHSPGKFRVIGALSNSLDFSRAYNCSLGSKMNPRHKCSVW